MEIAKRDDDDDDRRWINDEWKMNKDMKEIETKFCTQFLSLLSSLSPKRTIKHKKALGRPTNVEWTRSKVPKRSNGREIGRRTEARQTEIHI